MFDVALLSHGSAQVRRKAVAAIVNQRLQAGTFNYTELMSAPEPLSSDGFEVLDGVAVENTVPKNMMGPVENWEGRGIVLCHVLPTGRIFGEVIEKRRTPGTDDYKEVKRIKEYGNVAFVPDDHPARIARLILRRSGWPSLQISTKGSRIGSVVEWRWIEREVARPDVAPEVVEIYESIISREAFKKLGLMPVASDQKAAPAKSNSPGPTRAGASP